MARIYLGNVKGPQGETGATGATGPQGDAATVNVGSVSTTAYGNAAQVVNVGTENDAVLNFVIPQGKPGEKTTTMSGLTLDTVTTSADEFPVPAVSENGSTVWGKVIKFFQDTVAALTGKLDANKVVNSQAVTEAGYALDAQQANPNVSGSLAAQISGLNDSLESQTGYITRTSVSIRVGSDGVAYIHIPVEFRYALVIVRGAITGSAFNVAGIFYTNYYNSSQFTVLNKNEPITNVNATFGSTSGKPVIILDLADYYKDTTVACDIAVVACSLK